MKLFKSAIYKMQIWEDLEIAMEEGNVSDEMLQQMQDDLAELDIAINDKAVSIACVIKGCLADIEAYKVEKQRMDAKMKSATKTVNYLKDYMSDFLDKDIKIKDPKASISFRKSEKCIVNESATIPDEFKTIETVEKVKLNDIKAFIKSGEECDFAEIQTNFNIQVK